MLAEAELFEAWQPVEGLSRELYFESLTEQDGILTIKLETSEEDNVLVFRFEYAIIYRSTDETYRWASLAEVSSRTTGGNILGLWTVRNSKFLAWLDEESSGIARYNELTHYAFVLASGEVIDVLAGVPPEVQQQREVTSTK